MEAAIRSTVGKDAKGAHQVTPMTSEQAERIAKLLARLIEQNDRLIQLRGTDGPIYKRLGALLPGDRR